MFLYIFQHGGFFSSQEGFVILGTLLEILGFRLLYVRKLYSRVSNKRAGGNKAVQVGIFQKSIVKNHKRWKKIRAGGNKAVQVGNFQKINKLCCTFIR